jgi:hypothetical protein
MRPDMVAGSVATISGTVVCAGAKSTGFETYLGSSILTEPPHSETFFMVYRPSGPVFADKRHVRNSDRLKVGVSEYGAAIAQTPTLAPTTGEPAFVITRPEMVIGATNLIVTALSGVILARANPNPFASTTTKMGSPVAEK